MILRIALGQRSWTICILLLLIYYIYRRGDSGYAVGEAFDKKSKESLSAKIEQPVRDFVNKSNLLPPLFRFREIFLISPKYNLATCQIEKVMSTFRSGMFCYLNRKRQFEKEGRNISTEHWSNTLCDDERDERKTFDETIKSLRRNFLMFTVIREPLDRFLSGYTNKCVREKRVPEEKCFGCRGSMMCFLKTLKEKLMAFHNNAQSVFGQDIYYMRHFAPTTWYCDLEKSFNLMHVIRYDMREREKLVSDFNSVLHRARVPFIQRNYISRELLKKLPVHSTSNSKERYEVEKELLSNPQLLMMFVELYYYDFIVFDYKFPKRIL
ncbi:hypothetical protein Y032_0223g2653 [Ancylostoma ceylanicum]|uniref:Carbohydrate sulfotransferase n=1 Tax=Ancylostoma ceylanicum TaxID=53326 RepID=A0A016SIF1_9BILA|nr:hypothetical protein Y032_0223g2653 [Ancylostoma ceylanicum]